MANSKPIFNKVIYDGDTLIDITDTTATESDVLVGQTFYKANGMKGVGTLVLPEPNIMTVRLTSDYTIATANTTEQITTTGLYNSIGDKLTYNATTKRIVVGAGVSKVKVSYSAKCVASASTTRTFVYLVHNGTQISQEGAYFRATNDQIYVGNTPKLVDVNEGDYFFLQCYGAKNNKVAYGSSTFICSYFTVEVVE